MARDDVERVVESTVREFDEARELAAVIGLDVLDRLAEVAATRRVMISVTVTPYDEREDDASDRDSAG